MKSPGKLIGISVAIILCISLGLSIVTEKSKQAQKVKADQQVKQLKKQRISEMKHYSDAKLRATTYLNSSGHLYYQTDSLLGKKIRQSAERWNKSLGKKVFLASDSNQIVDLYITDTAFPLPQNEQNSIYGVLTTNHYAIFDIPAIISDQTDDNKTNKLIDEMFGQALGINGMKNQILTSKENDNGISKENTSKVKKIWDEASKNKSYSNTLFPLRLDFANKDVISYSFGMVVLPTVFKEKKLRSQYNALSDGVHQVTNQMKKSDNPKDGFTANTVASGGRKIKKLTRKLYALNEIDVQKENISKERQMSISNYQQNSVITIAGTTSTIISDNGQVKNGKK